MITKDKVTEIFCIVDDFCKEFDKEVSKMELESPRKPVSVIGHGV